MLVVVSYDIVDDKRRNKVHKALHNFGTRVQYSVFECELDDATHKRMQGQLGRLINKKEDSIRYYVLCETCLSKVKIAGLGEVTQVKPFRIV